MRNPIIPSDFPDPDIIRVGNVYYLASTTMYFMPGGDLLRFYDLVHWESLEDNPAHRLENRQHTSMHRACGLLLCDIILACFI